MTFSIDGAVMTKNRHLLTSCNKTTLMREFPGKSFMFKYVNFCSIDGRYKVYT